MNREQLAHIVRSAARIAGDGDIIILGSQSVLGLRDADSPVMASETEVHVRNSVTGPLRIDRGYRLFLTDSILDAGSGVNEDPATASYALSGADPRSAPQWRRGPPDQRHRARVRAA